jgi:pimeloyl-ACP methyl ester carboxylesterase
MPSHDTATTVIVHSADGTPIACRTLGQGPPLLLVHGTTDDHTAFTPVSARLARTHTVFAMDRRGRGASGDNPDYTVEREFEDVAAVLDHVGPGARAIGHSFGAICLVMGAHLRPASVARLVLYEPPLPIPGRAFYRDGFLERMQAAWARGDRDAVVGGFFAEVIGVPPRIVERMRSLPGWASRLAGAHTLMREMLVPRDHHLDVSVLAGWKVPCLLLRGQRSPTFLHNATALLARTLAASRTVELSGQAHGAIQQAPEDFLAAVAPFLGAPSNL